MDRGIWCTSALRIRTWEIGTVGTEWRGWAGDTSYLVVRTFSTPVQTPSWRYVPLCCAPSSPGRRGAVPGFSWQCAVRQSHPRHTGGSEARDAIIGSALCYQGVYLWQRGLLLNPDCLIVTAQQRTRIDSSGTAGRAVLCAKSAYRVILRTRNSRTLPIPLPTWATARRGSSFVWTQTDRLKTDIAGGPRSLVQPVEFPQFYEHSVL